MNKILILLFLLIVALWFSSFKGKKENFIFTEGNENIHTFTWNEDGSYSSLQFDTSGMKAEDYLNLMSYYSDEFGGEGIEEGINLMSEDTFNSDSTIISPDEARRLIDMNNHLIDVGIWDNNYNLPRLRLTDSSSILDYNFQSPLYTIETVIIDDDEVLQMRFRNDSSKDTFNRMFNTGQSLPDDIYTFTRSDLQKLNKVGRVDEDNTTIYQPSAQFSQGIGVGREIDYTNAQEFITNSNKSSSIAKMLHRFAKRLRITSRHRNESVINLNNERIPNARKIRGNRIEFNLNKFIDNNFPPEATHTKRLESGFYDLYSDNKRLDVRVVVPDTGDWKRTLSNEDNIEYDSVNNVIRITHTEVGSAMEQIARQMSGEAPKVITYTLDRHLTAEGNPFWILVDHNSGIGDVFPVLFPNKTNPKEIVVNSRSRKLQYKVNIDGQTAGGHAIGRVVYVEPEPNPQGSNKPPLYAPVAGLAVAAQGDYLPSSGNSEVHDLDPHYNHLVHDREEDPHYNHLVHDREDPYSDDNNEPSDDNNEPSDDNNEPSDDNNEPSDDNNEPTHVERSEVDRWIGDPAIVVLEGSIGASREAVIPTERLLLDLLHDDNTIAVADATSLTKEYAQRISRENPGKYLIRTSETDPTVLVFDIYFKGDKENTKIKIGISDNNKITIAGIETGYDAVNGENMRLAIEFLVQKISKQRRYEVNPEPMNIFEVNQRTLLYHDVGSDLTYHDVGSDLTYDDDVGRGQEADSPRPGDDVPINIPDGYAFDVPRERANEIINNRNNTNKYILAWSSENDGNITYMANIERISSNTNKIVKTHITVLDTGDIIYTAKVKVSPRDWVKLEDGDLRSLAKKISENIHQRFGLDKPPTPIPYSSIHPR